MWSLSNRSIGALAAPTKNICYVISNHCCVTSLCMRKLNRLKENTAAVLLALYVLRALSGNGFTCHDVFEFFRQ
jgi:hypothetical protein